MNTPFRFSLDSYMLIMITNKMCFVKICHLLHCYVDLHLSSTEIAYTIIRYMYVIALSSIKCPRRMIKSECKHLVVNLTRLFAYIV